MDTAFRDEVVLKGYGELIGKTISDVRPMTKDECEMYGWDYDHQLGWIIVFEDGTCAVPSADEEGNGRGHLFIEDLEPLEG
jgi:hypothetical protein